MTTLVAVETSGIEGSLALLVDGVVKEERSLAAEGRRNAQTLVLEAAKLLSDYELRPSDVDVVAVSVGPGSFTGLRVGITFAKTFCWANGAKLIAVDTFQALANCVDPSNQLVTVIGDAQRNELFISEYSADEHDRRSIVDEVRIETMEELLERSADSVGIVTGPALFKHHDVIAASHTTSPEEQWRPSAGAVAKTGFQQYLTEDFADMHQLEPLYIRRSYAEEKAGK